MTATLPPMVTLTGTITDASGQPVSGTVTAVPVALRGGQAVPVTVTDASGFIIVAPCGVRRRFDASSGGSFSMPLAATDTAGLAPSGWAYQFTLDAGSQGTAETFTALLPGSPATLDFSALVPAAPGTALNAYVPLTGGTLSGTLTLGGSPALRIPAGAAPGDFLGSDSSGNASWTAPATFSPLHYGAVGNGIANDTTPVLSAFSAAAAVGGVVDLGTKTYLTSSPIPLASFTHLRGAIPGGQNSVGGMLVNNTSDLFITTGNISGITIEDCSLIASAGHVFNIGNVNVSSFCTDGLWIWQKSPTHRIWNQTSGNYIGNSWGARKVCILQSAASSPATVAPWYWDDGTVNPGAFNDNYFGMMRAEGDGAMAPFFSITMDSSNGWSEETTFDQIIFEICPGGGIHMTGAANVQINMCADWDIPVQRTDTGCAISGTTVTDAAAVSGDLGSAIAGPGIPALTYITAVTPGTGYTISASSTTGSGLTLYVGGAAANFYSFTQSARGYACANIQVNGGREGNVGSGPGFFDFFADPATLNVRLDSFGAFSPPRISSPAAQTVIINGRVSGTASQTITSPSFTPAGINGATGASAAARYLAATTGGAPSSGTFAVGDVVPDQTGGMWICTGTPHTFTAVGGATATIQPYDVGAVAWTAAPDMGTVTTQWASGLNGFVLFWLFKVAFPATISNVSYMLASGGAGTSLSNCYFGIYSAGSTATLLGSGSAKTADQSTNLATANEYTAALGTPVAVTPGLYRLGFLIGAASTMPKFTGAGTASAFGGAWLNLGLSSPNWLTTEGSTGSLTALPSSTGIGGAVNCGLPIFVLT